MIKTALVERDDWDEDETPQNDDEAVVNVFKKKRNTYPTKFARVGKSIPMACDVLHVVDTSDEDDDFKEGVVNTDTQSERPPNKKKGRRHVPGSNKGFRNRGSIRCVLSRRKPS